MKGQKNMNEILSEEEKNLAFGFIIINLLVSALNQDISAINNSKLKLKSQHVLMLESVRDTVLKDAANLKKEMNRKKIKVLNLTPENVNEDFVSYDYSVRGYTSQFRCFRSALKVHTEKKLHEYYFKK